MDPLFGDIIITPMRPQVLSSWDYDRPGSLLQVYQGVNVHPKVIAIPNSNRVKGQTDLKMYKLEVFDEAQMNKKDNEKPRADLYPRSINRSARAELGGFFYRRVFFYQDGTYLYLVPFSSLPFMPRLMIHDVAIASWVGTWLTKITAHAKLIWRFLHTLYNLGYEHKIMEESPDTITSPAW